MGQHSKALGQGSQFEWGGETWVLSPWTFKIQGAYEQYLEEEAMRTVRRMISILDEKEYKDLLQRCIQDIAAGVYSFGSEIVHSSLSSAKNFIHLLWLSLRDNHPDLKKDRVQEMVIQEPDLIMQKMLEANDQGSEPEGNDPEGDPEE